MYLTGIATALPSRCYRQEDLWHVYEHSALRDRLRPRSTELLGKILLGDNGIETRYLAAERVGEIFDLDAQALNRTFEAAAPPLAEQALRPALENAGVPPGELDALYVCTCTGYLCPGLTSYLSERLGLRADAYLQDLVGLGCGAAIPTLRSAAHHVAAHPEAKVAVVAVEICSAAFYLDDDPGVIISACLFGDGAAATIWTGTPPAAGPSWRCGAFDTVVIPEKRDILRFENREGKLRNLLHRSVPREAGNAVRQLFERDQARGHARPDALILHAGGRDVLDAIEQTVPGYTSPWSREVLRQCGNMSSPSVLFALERFLTDKKAKDAQRLWLSSFGAGFSAHSCALERE
ncbi:MAG: 3-oxoacyl-[acyl-carrier-protein] synthase III C-terminal domain-containing protein [Verrucomicrobiota bacterium JB022]|nr:3-oxoacyl-[acyl-carrier-protein] synthase III C-terminal domain-containing protein [Verrucomicrobiota bacterium JB022]